METTTSVAATTTRGISPMTGPRKSTVNNRSATVTATDTRVRPPARWFVNVEPRLTPPAIPPKQAVTMFPTPRRDRIRLPGTRAPVTLSTVLAQSRASSDAMIASVAAASATVGQTDGGPLR
jgi:hypothetical protein